MLVLTLRAVDTSLRTAKDMTSTRSQISPKRHQTPTPAPIPGSSAMALSTLVILLAISTSVQAETRLSLVDWSRSGYAAALADNEDQHPRRRSIRPDHGRRLGASLVRAARELLGVRVISHVAHAHPAVAFDGQASLAAQTRNLRAGSHDLVVRPPFAVKRPDLLNLPPPVCG